MNDTSAHGYLEAGDQREVEHVEPKVKFTLLTQNSQVDPAV